MSKKNKKHSKPAVGSPVAGSNNKREKIKPLKEKIKINKKVVFAVVTLTIIALIIAIIIMLPVLSVPGDIRNADFKGRLEPDSIAVKTTLSSSQQDKLARSVRSSGNGKFDFYVNEEVTIDEHTDPVLLELGSVEANDCVLTAILIDENDKILYRSLGIEPGEEIRSVRLFDTVSYGTHQATLVVNGYNSETYEKVGTQTVKIQLKIGVDEIEK